MYILECDLSKLNDTAKQQQTQCLYIIKVCEAEKKPLKGKK